MNDEPTIDQLKAAFDEGYREGYSEGGNDASHFEYGGGSRSQQVRDIAREQAWEYSDTATKRRNEERSEASTASGGKT